MDAPNSGPGSTSYPADEAAPAVRTAIEVSVRLGVIVLIVAWCLQIIAPFVGIVIWAMIIAIAVDAPFAKICGLTGGYRRTTAIVGVTLILVVLAVPTVMLSETLVSGAQGFAEDLAAGKLQIPAPPAEVSEWPIIGERVYDFWKLGSQNLREALSRIGPQLEAISRWLLSAAGSVGAGILQLVASLLIAGVMLARSEGRQRAISHFAARLAGPERGPELAKLSYATVQSVVNGIVGVALVQSLLAGLGFIVAGIPAGGLWALLVLVAAVVQIPVALVMLPPIFLAFSSMEVGYATIFTVWCLFVGTIDNFLKPLLFGRGVEVPTIVIFMGAIGGMLSMGIVGLFLGAVVLALGYELFIAWLGAPEQDASTATAPTS